MVREHTGRIAAITASDDTFISNTIISNIIRLAKKYGHPGLFIKKNV